MALLNISALRLLTVCGRPQHLLDRFFGTLKGEWVHHRAYRTRQEARADIFYYIEAFYNPCRLHSALGYLSPAAFEALYRQSAGLA